MKQPRFPKGCLTEGGLVNRRRYPRSNSNGKQDDFRMKSLGSTQKKIKCQAQSQTLVLPVEDSLHTEIRTIDLERWHTVCTTMKSITNRDPR